MKKLIVLVVILLSTSFVFSQKDGAKKMAQADTFCHSTSIVTGIVMQCRSLLYQFDYHQV